MTLGFLGHYAGALGRAAHSVDNGRRAGRAQMGLVVLPVGRSLGLLISRLCLLPVRDIRHNKQVARLSEAESLPLFPTRRPGPWMDFSLQQPGFSTGIILHQQLSAIKEPAKNFG
jgi:hypothetical protein